MKQKSNEKQEKGAGAGFENQAARGDFYSVAPTEKPLLDARRTSTPQHVRRTARHQAHSGRKEQADPRERGALIFILKMVLTIILLIIGFLLLRQGIGVYEKNITLKNTANTSTTPVPSGLAPIEDFEENEPTAEAEFASRIEAWKDAERQVRLADEMMLRGNMKEAIDRCQRALRSDHLHRGALGRLGGLYFEEKEYMASINAYIRLFSIDPADGEVQKNLIRSLEAAGDFSAVMQMAEWYEKRHDVDREVRGYLASALYAQKEYAKAIEVYERILIDGSENVTALERLGAIYMHLDQHKDAVSPFIELMRTDNRNPTYYRDLAICYAQLRQANEAVNILGRGAQVFGDAIVVGWLKDPRMDVIREERVFQGFADRVAGQKTRKWLEQMARNMEKETEDDSTDSISTAPDSFQPSNQLLKKGE